MTCKLVDEKSIAQIGCRRLERLFSVYSLFKFGHGLTVEVV